MYKKASILLAIITLFFAGCGEPIPIKEMSYARKAISKALTVKADKYAPKEFEEARDKLFESHGLVKKDELEKAKKAAQESYDKAIEAYNKAVPLLAKDTIQGAEKSLEKAKEAYGEHLAKNEFNEATALLQDANKKFEAKEYYDSYLTALEADKKASEAYRVAIGKKGTLQDEIDEVNVTLRKAGEYNASKYAPEKVRLANENVKEAEKAYQENMLKKGFSAVEAAKVSAEDAYLAALAGTAKDKHAEAKAIVAKAETTEGAGVAVNEMAASKESLENSSNMIGEARYKESMSYSAEAVRLARVVIATKKPVVIEEEKEPVEKSPEEIAREKEEAERLRLEKEREEALRKKEEEERNRDHWLYTVQKRDNNTDCLWVIAGKYYKNPRLWKVIYRANKDKIKNPNLIKPGWVLKIPKLEKMKSEVESDVEIEGKEGIDEEVPSDDETDKKEEEIDIKEIENDIGY